MVGVMDKLTVTARLKAPIILGGGYLTLDGLLANLIFEKTGDIATAHNTVPLTCTDGLFHGSAALLEPFGSSVVSFVANMRAVHALDPDLILKNKHGNIHKQIGLTRRRDFGAVMNGYGKPRHARHNMLVAALLGRGHKAFTIALRQSAIATGVRLGATQAS